MQDLLQYLAIAAFFDAFGRSSKKVGGGKWCGKKWKLSAEKNFEFGLGTPPPLETSAARSHNRLSLLESSRNWLWVALCAVFAEHSATHNQL